MVTTQRQITWLRLCTVLWGCQMKTCFHPGILKKYMKPLCNCICLYRCNLTLSLSATKLIVSTSATSLPLENVKELLLFELHYTRCNNVLKGIWGNWLPEFKIYHLLDSLATLHVRKCLFLFNVVFHIIGTILCTFQEMSCRNNLHFQNMLRIQNPR